jgi:CBS domain containing-hemolysin-like protein
MPDPSTAAFAPPPLFEFPLGDLATLAWLAGALLISGALGLLQASLEFIPSSRALARVPAGPRHERLAALLSAPDKVLVSASFLKLAFELIFLALLLPLVAPDGRVDITALLIAIAIGVPCLLLLSEAMPQALARRHGDRVLAACLLPFHALQLPLAPIVAIVRFLRDAILRASQMEEADLPQQQAVDELREVIEETGHTGELEESEREMLENVIEFHDVDVSAVMTPRTDIRSIDVEEGLPAALELAVESSLSRIPVYEGSIDTIVGYLSERLLLHLLAKGELETASVRDHLQPALFVPETQQVSALLAEFRAERQKMAIILDEYGGTSGLVTISDVLEELVGELQDEFSDEAEPEDIRPIAPGVSEIAATARVDEINEALNLGLPEEEDYETLAGFVLSELGHIPRPGDQFDHANAHYEVTEASDRRVICVRVTT